MLLLAGLIAVVQLAVYLLVSHANERSAFEHIDQNLRIGAKIFRQNLSERIDYLAGSAKLLSNDYQIRKLIMQDPVDRKTLQSTLRSYADRVRSNPQTQPPLITLFTVEGDLLATSADNQELATENIGPFRYLIRLAGESDMERAS